MTDDAIIVDGRRLTLKRRRNARARRVVMRLDAAAGELRVTTPRGLGDARLRRFIEDHAGWIAEKLRAAPTPTTVAAGARLPFRGVATAIQHDPTLGRRVVWCATDARIGVGGEAAHLPARLAAWLKDQARRDLSARAHAYAARLDRGPIRIRIADQRSRWGSCSSTGTLSFSWRLILAPDAVRDYVAAHEAAHLVEMNHSTAFWATLQGVYRDIDAAQAWLSEQGPDLRRYVFPG
ncbi:MAG: SprT family zinc-dependent metalloprotease [Pseudomonadota bacterium]